MWILILRLCIFVVSVLMSLIILLVSFLMVVFGVFVVFVGLVVWDVVFCCSVWIVLESELMCVRVVLRFGVVMLVLILLGEVE